MLGPLLKKVALVLTFFSWLFLFVRLLFLIYLLLGLFSKVSAPFFFLGWEEGASFYEGQDAPLSSKQHGLAVKFSQFQSIWSSLVSFSQLLSRS